MNDAELKNLLNDPKRILNIIRVFHNVLHEYDKMEELKAKQTMKKPGITPIAMSDKVEITLKDKNGNIKNTKKEVKK